MKYILIVLLFIQQLSAQVAPVDSLSLTLRVPAKEYVYCAIDVNNKTITATPSFSTGILTEKAREAISYGPSWLSVALEDRFAHLNTALQDTCARIILTARDPYVDEIAFTIAHLPNEVLINKGFYFSIIGENAETIYRADSGLDYVSIIDSGSASTGGNYFSTTQYNALEDEKEVTYTLPRDIYYWYIVHPKLQGELPTYISPNNPNPTDPPTGKFWRSYLWSHKETGYGALCDTMKNVPHLWANKINNPAENGALGRLSEWCNDVLPWGGGYPDYRWPQPVYLYHQHCGTCSEHGWFANAAARTVLIPVTLTKAPRYDHKWNEFFYRRWIDWEPINGWIARIDEPNHANDYWSDPSKGPLNGCFNWRGDGFIWGSTDHYSPVCTLAVSVSDAAGNPVDGARITIDADGVPGNFLLAGWTGSDGFCEFLLGDDVVFFTGAVQSILGNVNASRVITNSETGKRYEWAPKVQKNGNSLKVRLKQPTSESASVSTKITCTLDASEEVVYGKHEYSLYGYSFPCTFSDRRATGTIDFFICDEENFKKYQNGDSCDASFLKENISTFDSSIVLPNTTSNQYLVVTGDKKEVVTSIADLSLSFTIQSDVDLFTYHRHKTCEPNILLTTNRKVLNVFCNFSEDSYATLDLLTIAGKPVCRLFEGVLKKGGRHSFNTDHFPTGIYYCKISSKRVTLYKKILLLK